MIKVIAELARNQPSPSVVSVAKTLAVNARQHDRHPVIASSPHQ
jgi:hypothetical protein